MCENPHKRRKFAQSSLAQSIFKDNNNNINKEESDRQCDDGGKKQRVLMALIYFMWMLSS